MQDRVLVFIPYQDSDNFYSDGILTREFAMLYMLYQHGYNKVINVKKPRTILDKKRYIINDSFYPEGTVEYQVKKILDNSKTIQYLPIISIEQIILKRGWWSAGYVKSTRAILEEIDDNREWLVYSDNPYAAQLLMLLKQKGAKIYFDVMDNFAIHPSLNEKERKEALKGYKKIFTFADIVSANSQQTCDYMKEQGADNIMLVKNGVFLNNKAKYIGNCNQILRLEKEKKKYSKTVGYIGKLGKRLDAALIKSICKACQDTLFVFVGPYLEGQINEELITLFKQDNNVLHLEGIPSAFVYAMLDKFDILMIPHSVGKNENGGDPLKLYQYLTRNKPIITTPILGVDEFQNCIEISSDVDKWIEFIRDKKKIGSSPSIHFDWMNRMAPVLKEID